MGTSEGNMGPTKENRQIYTILRFFRPTQKMAGRAPNGAGTFFSGIKNLADILGRTDFDFEYFYFLDFLGPHLGPSLGPAWAQAWAWAWARAWAQAWARAWAQTPPAPPDELSDPNLTPLPTYPGIKYVARTLAATLRFLDLQGPFRTCFHSF